MSQTSLFSLTDQVPMGETTLIEASAGTGKTYTLAALTTRLVAEHDVAIEEILLATFNTAAADELRERIRSALVEAEVFLRNPSTPASAVLELLADVDVDQRRLRHERLARSIRNFDRANIATIHGFCTGVLEAMGALRGRAVSPGAETVSEGELIRQVCSDVLFAEAAASEVGRELPKLESLLQAVRFARNSSECVITAESETPVDKLLVDLANRALQTVAERLSSSGTLSFNVMISSVRDRLSEEPQLSEQIRRRFRVALLDEFQDTDSTQWEIFKTIFENGQPRPTLIMVGDPKQAIYGFRGGDVYTYLNARIQLEPRYLGTNHRSVPRVIRAMNAVGSDQIFGDAKIAYQQVESSERNRTRRLDLVDGESVAEAPGLQIRHVDHGRSFESEGKRGAQQLKDRIAEDLADTVIKLLDTGRLVSESPGATTKNDTLEPGHIAVLVGSSFTGHSIAKVLTRRGIPAVKLMGDSVLTSEAAKQWKILLTAMEIPSDQRKAGAAALSWFFGWSADDLASAVADTETVAEGATRFSDLIEVQYQLAKWARVVETHGVSALFTEIRRTSNVIPNLLADPDGERNLTDLEHIAELLHSEAGGRTVGASVSSALESLDTLMIDQADGSKGSREVAGHLQRRVESDGSAVQIMTIHRAKGLEFPVVLLPDLCFGGERVQARGARSYFDKTAAHRFLDVSTWEGGEGESKKRRGAKETTSTTKTREQNCGEQHRLTYVALTRATHLSVAWWTANQSGCALTGLARLLFGVGKDAAASAKVDIGDQGTLVERLNERFSKLGAGDSISVETVPKPDPTPSLYRPPSGERADVRSTEPESTNAVCLKVARLGRDLDRTANRWSFSSLKDKITSTSQSVTVQLGETAALTDPTITNSDDRGAGDEALVSYAAPGGPDPTELGPDWELPNLFDGLGAGTEFGTMVHELYESVDFTDPDPEGAFRAALQRGRRLRSGTEIHDRLPLALARSVETPLGGSLGELRLADIPAGDRLNELDFYIPVAPGAVLPGVEIGRIVGDHLEDDHPLRPWADQVCAGLRSVDLTGYLSGAIDLIFRYRSDGQQKFSVLDYKTNMLSGVGSPGLAAYHPESLVNAMEHSHYVLQALIYSVALHRYLRLRLPDYQPSTHLGPVVYAFVRGMVGPDAPVVDSGFWKGARSGAFVWDVPTGLIEDLSDAFGSGSTVGRERTGEGSL